MGDKNSTSATRDAAWGEPSPEAHGSRTILMMSTLAIQPLAPVYGTPVVAYTLRTYLKAGWTIFFAAAFSPKPVDNELVQQLRVSWFGGPVLRTLRTIGRRVPKIGFFARAVWWLITQVLFCAKGFRIVSQHKVNLIYSWDVYAAPAAWVLSQLFGIPWVARYLGTCVDINKPLWRIRFWPQILAYKLPADMVIMTNDGTQGDRVLQKLGVDLGRVRFWLNGVNWEMFGAMPRKQEAKTFLKIEAKYVLLCLSRLDKWKHVDRALRVLPTVLPRFPDLVLLIVGDGPERKNLERLALELGVREHVRFEGAVPHCEVPRYLAAADLFLSFYDLSNVGNPLLEAMMTGKCVISLDNGDTGRLVRNGENGILLDYEDLPKAPEVIKRLLGDEDLRTRLGNNARTFAKENFWSWEERLEGEVAEVSSLVVQRARGRIQRNGH